MMMARISIFILSVLSIGVMYGGDTPECRSYFSGNSLYTFTEYDAKKHRNDLWAILHEPLHGNMLCYHELRSDEDETAEAIMQDIGLSAEDLTIVALQKTARVAGFIHWNPVRSQIIYLAVGKQHQRTRLGSALVGGTLRYQKKFGAPNVHLATHTQNIIAQNFYKNIGFHVTPMVCFETGDLLSAQVLEEYKKEFNNPSWLIINEPSATKIGYLIQHNIEVTGETCLAVFKDLQKNDVSRIGLNILPPSSVWSILGSTSKLLALGGAALSGACTAGYAPHFIQQRCRWVYGLTALGAIGYGVTKIAARSK